MKAAEQANFIYAAAIDSFSFKHESFTIFIHRDGKRPLLSVYINCYILDRDI